MWAGGWIRLRNKTSMNVHSFFISCLSLSTSTKCFVTERHLLDSLRRGLWFSPSVQCPARPRCWRMMWQLSPLPRNQPQFSFIHLRHGSSRDYPLTLHHHPLCFPLSSCRLWSSLSLLLCLFLLSLLSHSFSPSSVCCRVSRVSDWCGGISVPQKQPHTVS